MRVKICGLTNIEDVKKSYDLGANYFGFIFFSKSPRYISSIKVSQILQNLNIEINAVAVFVNETYDNIMNTLEKTNIHIIQLHGNESQNFIEKLQNKQIKVIKAISIKDETSFSKIHEYNPDNFLLDTWHPKLKGGVGTPFNWKLIPDDIFKTSFIAGGISPENIKNLLSSKKPFAIDVSSGVEKLPGRKDHIKLAHLFNNIL